MAKIFTWPKAIPDPDKNTKHAGLTQYESECRSWAIGLLTVSLVLVFLCLLGSGGPWSTSMWRGASCIIFGLWTSAMALWNARVMTALFCGGFFLAVLLIWFSFF